MSAPRPAMCSICGGRGRHIFDKPLAKAKPAPQAPAQTMAGRASAKAAEMGYGYPELSVMRGLFEFAEAEVARVLKLPRYRSMDDAIRAAKANLRASVDRTTKPARAGRGSRIK